MLCIDWIWTFALFMFVDCSSPSNELHKCRAINHLFLCSLLFTLLFLFCLSVECFCFYPFLCFSLFAVLLFLGVSFHNSFPVGAGNASSTLGQIGVRASLVIYGIQIDANAATTKTHTQKGDNFVCGQTHVERCACVCVGVCVPMVPAESCKN